MAAGGEVFILDMGEPVRISNLAQQMISLAGYTIKDEKNTDGDIEIQYVGLRPGEKCYEELSESQKVFKKYIGIFAIYTKNVIGYELYKRRYL